MMIIRFTQADHRQFMINRRWFFSTIFCFYMLFLNGFSLADSGQFETMQSRAQSNMLVSENGDVPLPLETRTVVITGADQQQHRFMVEIADTPESRARGLMFRHHLEPDAGMLFVYPEPRPVSIWMKNTYLSLDILYIDHTGRIAQIIEHAAPLSETLMPSQKAIQSVLELPAGSVARLGIALGNVVSVVYKKSHP